MKNVAVKELLEAANACDRAADAATVQEERRAVMDVIAHQEAIQIGLITAEMNRRSQTPHTTERLPLRESGDDIGQMEARIPKKLFFHLLQQKNFGYDGLTSDEGMRDLLKAWPSCRVKTISGKTTVGYRRKAGMNFGRGTIEFAK